MESQSTSIFFKAPIEIRRIIYSHFVNSAGIHVYRDAEDRLRLRLARCLGPDPLANLTGCERSTHPHIKSWWVGDYYYEPTWARRIQSVWGPHWECAETAMTARQPDDRSGFQCLLRVCRLMHFELVDFMLESAPVHVADLWTIHRLLEEPDAGIEYSPSASNILDMIRPRLRFLSITLTKPLQFFEALENPIGEVEHPSGGASTSNKGNGIPGTSDSKEILPLEEIDTAISDWLAVPRLVSKLPHLRHLHVWLDHTDGQVWSTVNERATLSHFEDLVNTPNLTMKFILPKIHPYTAKPEMHYTSVDIGSDTRGPAAACGSKIEIIRTLRQQLRVSVNRRGDHQIVQRSDFPHYYDSIYFPSTSVAEMEALELAKWHTGVCPSMALEEHIREEELKGTIKIGGGPRSKPPPSESMRKMLLKLGHRLPNFRREE